MIAVLFYGMTKIKNAMKYISLRHMLALALTALLFLAVSCKENGKAKPSPTANTETEDFQDLQEPQVILPPENPNERVSGKTRSLREIRESGLLKVLTVRDPELPHLQRAESVQERELALLTSLADWLNVKIQLIYAENYDALVPSLLRGKGDIIAANMTVTPERQRQMLFSLPIDTVREQLIGPSSCHVRNLNELNGKTVVVERGTAYWQNANDLRRRYPGIKVLSSETDTEALMADVGAGRIDFTVADDNYLDNYLHYRQNIKAVFTFPGIRQIAWGMDKKSAALHQAIDIFLKKELPLYRQKNGKFDFASLQRRRILRVITRDNPVNYFIHRGRMMGFEYELAKKFANDNQMHLVMITPPDQKYMIPWLLAGKGDIIASTMTVTEARRNNPAIALCEPYLTVSEVVVTRKNDNSIRNTSDLGKRTFAVRAESSYMETLQEMKRAGIKFNIRIVPDNISSFEILQGIADGKYDITLVDDLILKAKLQGGDNLKPVLMAGKSKKYAWIVRDTSPELQTAVNDFFRREIRGAFFNQLYRRYFEIAKESRQYWLENSASNKFEISPFDPMVKKYSHLNSFDWCMISAQIYQESRFDPLAIAPDGGLGLMQLMPQTAQRFKCVNPLDPESNVKTGTTYLNRLRDAFEGPVQPYDRLCFALAGYNGGIGHVFDARLLAASQGLNPNVWKDNVEVALYGLSTTEYASRARFGFCRADIITNYVNQIMLRYYHYKQMTEEREHAALNKGSKK